MNDKKPILSTGKIKSVAVVTQAGASSHWVGENGVASIKMEAILFTGDPYDHYVGRDEQGGIIFTVNALAPVEVIYFTKGDL